MQKQEIFALDKKALQESIANLKLPTFRSNQILDWLYKKHVFDFAQMTNLAKKDVELLKNDCKILPENINILADSRSKDGLTNKLLIEFEDKNTIEAVGMKHDYGNSICISSQVGCAINCKFCASTLNGFVRNLTAGEMLAQVALFKKQFSQTGQDVNNIVIMGSGEPLLNYDNLLQFLHLIHDKDIYNCGFRNITISTCGIVPQINNLAKENIPVNLAISLHAPEDDLRSSLMPINDKYKIKDVIDSATGYANTTKRQITYEYMLIKGVNDSKEMANKLALLLKNKLVSVNLIPVNPVAELNWERPEQKAISDFLVVLKKHNISATVRKEMGTDIMAACGQLRRKHLQAQNN